MVRKYIPIPIDKKDNFKEKNYLDKYINTNFCRYIFKKGTYEGKYCNISCYNGNELCKKHLKLLERKTISEKKRMEVQRCIADICNRKCIENESYCRNHKSKIKKSTYKNDNDSNNKNNYNTINIIVNDSNIPKSININLEKKKKKRLRYKENKKKKRKLFINNKYVNIFNYNEILKFKKGILFKEEKKWYTYNLYEQKVIADCIEGINCSYCNFIRYTTSGPCIYADCINRSFSNYEFDKYFEINKKELISIYNKRLKN